jgi:hypothetical protein
MGDNLVAAVLLRMARLDAFDGARNLNRLDALIAH